MSADDTNTRPPAVDTADTNEGTRTRQPAGAPSNLSHGLHIEGYEVIRELHRGGQGIVYQAIQTGTQRKVALKILLEGPHASPAARRRFEREVELVAQLKHPSIIAIFHSGQSADGRQFYVMDYVRGVPLNQYVRDKKLTLEETLKLFTVVCEAVQYAHQRGIIHRDLKPSNILVDTDGVPRILDFGLAKWLAAPAEPVVSISAQVIGTLPYMSPEQARGNPDEIDTRTDVYALGVILYELLTGHYAYPVAGNMVEVLKHITETPPTPPSKRWSADSGVTHRSRGRLREGQCPIDDEVQTIVLKALSKERDRRYQSAENLSRDIQHYLAQEPIEAKRDSGWYVLKKALGRYRIPVAISAAFVIMLACSSIALWTMYENQTHERRRAELAVAAESKQRQRAESEQRKAQAISSFVKSALVSSDPQQKGQQDFKVVDAMQRATRQLDSGELKDQPETEAMLRLTIAEILVGNARAKEALSLAQRALETNQRLHAGDHPDLALSLNDLAACLDALGRSEEALPHYQAALEMRQRLFDGDHADVAQSLNNVAYCLDSLGRPLEALPMYQAALEMYQRLYSGDHADIAASMSNLAHCLKELGRLKEAHASNEAALEMRRRIYPGDHPDLAKSLNNVASGLQSMGRPAEALPGYQAALEMHQRLFRGDQLEVAQSLNNVAYCLQSLGRSTDALSRYQAALEMRQRLFRGDHPSLALSFNNIAACLQSMGRPSEALPNYVSALEMYQRVFHQDHPAVAGSLSNVASCLRSLNRYDEALPRFQAALEMHRRLLPAGHPGILYPQIGMAVTLAKLNRFADAEPLLVDAAEQCQRNEQSRRQFWPTLLNSSIRIYDAWNLAEPGKGHDVQSAEWRTKLSEWQATTRPATQPSRQPASTPLGRE